MAVITTHILNGVAGTHAVGVAVTLTNRDTGVALFEGETDRGGRLQLTVEPDRIDPTATYDLTLATGAYWATQDHVSSDAQTVTEFVFRFAMPDPAKHYHIPVNLSPHSHAVWWSA